MHAQETGVAREGGEDLVERFGDRDVPSRRDLREALRVTPYVEFANEVEELTVFRGSWVPRNSWANTPRVESYRARPINASKKCTMGTAEPLGPVG